MVTLGGNLRNRMSTLANLIKAAMAHKGAMSQTNLNELIAAAEELDPSEIAEVLAVLEKEAPSERLESRPALRRFRKALRSIGFRS